VNRHGWLAGGSCDQEGSEYQAAGADERAGARLPEVGLGSEENDRLLTTIISAAFLVQIAKPDTLRATSRASEVAQEVAQADE
jgi:hypothetical protein